MDRIAMLPADQRQPDLIFAPAKFLDAALDEPHGWIELAHDHWSQVHQQIMGRWTQTNEAARTGVILSVLTQIPGEIALIEAGASAGPSLYPDRYRIICDDHRPVGPPDSLVQIHPGPWGLRPSPTRCRRHHQ